MGLGRRSPRLLERDTELAATADLLDGVAAGRGSILVLRGWAGIGKTSLLRAAQRRAEQRGMLVLSARGSDFERDFPFGTAHQLFDPVVNAATEAVRDALFAGRAGLARPLFQGTGAAEDAGAAIEGLAWLVAHLAAERPDGILVAIDDVQACDRPTLRLLVRLALVLDRLPVGVVLTHRPGEGPDDELISWLSVDPLTTLLQPAPLSTDAVAALLQAHAGQPVAGLADACVEVTGGTPFLVGELLAALGPEGSIAPDAVERVRRMVPDAVLHAVAARVARLGDDARRLAQAVAVLGSGAGPADAGRLARLAPASVSREADRLAAVGLFAPGAPFSFRHPLLAAAVTRDVGAMALASLHREAAALLEGRAPTERVAAHLLASPPANEPGAVAVLRGAAVDAMRQGSPESAVALLRRALAEPPPIEVHGVVLHELARAEAAAGEPTARTHLLAALDLLAEREELVAALRDLGRLQFLGEHHQEAAVTIQRAMAEVGQSGPLAHDLLAEFIAVAGFGSATIDAAVRSKAEAETARLLDLHRAGAVPDRPALLVQVANVVAGGRGRRAEVRSLVGRALDHGPLEDVPPFGLAPSWATLALLSVDALCLAGEIADQSLASARAQGSLHALATAAFSSAIVKAERGLLPQAEQDAEHAVALAQSGVNSTLPWSAALLGTVRSQRGDSEGARRAFAIGERTDPDGLSYGIVLHHLARHEVLEGNLERARSLALDAGDRLARYGLRDYPLAPWRLVASSAAHALGRLDESRDLADEEVALARRAEAPRQLAEALMCRAAAENGSAPLPLLEEAVEVLAGSEARLVQAEALHRLGAARRRQVGHQAARDPLLRALEAAESCGAAVLEERVRSELRLVGMRPRRAQRVGILALSPAEHRTATLAATGLSNREVAAALHLSTSTVEFHLTRAYRKLGITSRRELARVLTGQEEPAEPVG